MGSPLRCPLRCPLSCPLFVFGSSGLPTELPLFPYMEVVGSLICMANFPWAAHGQPTPLPTPLPTELPSFYIFGSSGLPTELPTVSIYGSSGQPNLHGKIPIPICSPRQPTPLPTCSPWEAKWAAPLFFSVWILRMTVKRVLGVAR